MRAYRKGWASLHSTTRKHEEEDVNLYSRVVRKGFNQDCRQLVQRSLQRLYSEQAQAVLTVGR